MTEIYTLVYQTNPVYVVGIGFLFAVGLLFLKIWCLTCYGMLEVIVGIYLLYDATGKGRGAFSAGFSTGFDSVQPSVTLLQLVLAIYFTCGGLEKATKRWREKK